jgi:hypothetical protein
MSNKYTYKLPFTKEQLQVDYWAGLSQVEIAARYHTTQKVVWRAMSNLGIKARTAAKRNQKGSSNDSWKGDAAGYSAFHKRIEVLKGRPRKCEQCGTTDIHKNYDWANLTGRYEDPKDYRRLCRSCHWKMDKKILNIIKMRKRGATCQKTE